MRNRETNSYSLVQGSSVQPNERQLAALRVIAYSHLFDRVIVGFCYIQLSIKE